MKILIISGGISSERKISFTSARHVKKALQEVGYRVKIFDLKDGYEKLEDLSRDYDIIFPVIHGEEGEGGKLNKFLATLGKPYVGGNWKGYKKGWYKIPFKKFCEKNNIPTSPWQKIKTKQEIKNFGFPSVLKSSSGGSSKEVAILKTSKDLRSYPCYKLLKSNLPLFVEKHLSGIEVTVGILRNEALPIIEIIPPKGSWFSYENKYSSITKELVNAPSLDNTLKRKVQEIALGIHKKLNLGAFSRIDFIISKNVPYCLEVNTIPGMTAQSLFPLASKEAGITFPQLVKKLVTSAFEK